MKRIVKVRLLPKPHETEALAVTLRTCNQAASWLSARMHEEMIFDKHGVQRRFYTEIRERFGLAAQPTIRVIAKVSHAYASFRGNIRGGNFGPPGSRRRHRAGEKPVAFRLMSAQPFDIRCLSWRVPEESARGFTVSIWTAHGRLKSVRGIGRPRDLADLRAGKIGETDLICNDGKWYLHATVDTPDAARVDPVNGFIGVDMGIANIATTSDGYCAVGARLNRYRRRQARLRQRLQAKKTTSARRLLRKRRRREARFAADINHQISKRIVTEAQRTGRGIAVEDLRGIQGRVRFRKPQRVAVHSWAFAQLRAFLAYKAQRCGVVYLAVDPAYTSQMCRQCGLVDKRNRRSQSEFRCTRCSFVGHADHNAAGNIADRGVARWGEVMRPYAAPTPAASRGGSCEPIGTSDLAAAMVLSP